MNGLRVLIVDNDTDTADTTGFLLRTFGCETSVHYGGATVLEAAAGFRPQLMLIDLAMPTIDGCELLRRLRGKELVDSAKAVAVSGLTDDSYRRLAIDAGFDDFIIKPFDLATIKALLATFIERPTGDFPVELGQTYRVRWAGEEFAVQVRGRGIVQAGSWVCTRLDTNQPIVLPDEAFREQV